jgi:signal peptidase
MASRITSVWHNQLFRTILILGLLVGATYGAIELLKIALNTESPLMVVSSGSMIPVLNVGDIIIVRGVDPSQIGIGSIIIFHSPRSYETPIVHRVIAIQNENGGLYFKTKGDNNPNPDNWYPMPGVPSRYVMGIYVAKIPYLGLISLSLKGPIGFVLIVILFVTVIVLEYAEGRKKQSPEAHARATYG